MGVGEIGRSRVREEGATAARVARARVHSRVWMNGMDEGGGGDGEDGRRGRRGGTDKWTGR